MKIKIPTYRYSILVTIMYCYNIKMDFPLVVLKLIEQVLAYIAGFGFSDYFVEVNKLKGKSYLLYYTFIAMIALGILYYNEHDIFKNKSN